MRYIFSECFTEIFFYLCLICYETFYSNISAYATSLNSSEEIKNIFSLSEAGDSVLKGAPKVGNFAEGGPIIENLTQSSMKTYNKNLFKNSESLINISASSDPRKRQNISSLYNNLMQNESYNYFGLSSKKILPTKLTETESNLFLGMPELIHKNGTSSGKPFKDAHYSKIVPRKGVDNENEGSHSYLGNQSCLWLNENDCYSTKKIKDLDCFCCEEGNTVGMKIKQQASVTCKNCNSDNTLPSESKRICKNICCNSDVHDIYSVTTKDIYDNYLNYPTLSSAEKKPHNSFISQISGTISEIVNADKNSFNSSKKNSKLKPSITKVPYDVEVMTELLSKHQQKVFVPIIVSLFLLPLVGILMFFLWRRIKEHWDKRFYKRTDFLIDGMYND